MINSASEEAIGKWIGRELTELSRYRVAGQKEAHCNMAHPRRKGHLHKGVPWSGEGGIRTHGDRKGHNAFRERPDQPLWHLSINAIVF